MPGGVPQRVRAQLTSEGFVGLSPTAPTEWSSRSGTGPSGMARNPRRGGLGGVLAEALCAIVHHGRDFGQVGVAVWVGQVGTY